MIKLLQVLRSQKSSLSAPIAPSGVADNTEDYSAHLYLGNMYVTLGKIDRAEEEYVRAHEIRPCAEIAGLIAGLELQRIAQKRSSSLVVRRIRIGRAA